jgi:hypothetical protein
MKPFSVINVLIVCSFLLISCKKDEKKSIAEEISGTYHCLMGNINSTLEISECSSEKINIVISGITKTQIAFNQITVKKNEGEYVTYDLISSEILNGTIMYLENGKSYELKIEWTDGQISGYKNYSDALASKEICGVYDGTLDEISVKAEITEADSNKVDIKLYSNISNFTTINLNNIKVEKFVIDSLGRLAVCPYFELTTDNQDVSYSKIDFLEAENRYEMYLHFTDSRFYKGVLVK